MRKLFASALIIASLFAFGLAQSDETSRLSREELARLARAPRETDGIGRAVIFVSDENGNPVKGAHANLESTYGDDRFCESFGSTNNEGAIALLPIHMGKLKLSVKAKGYETAHMDVSASSLSEPVRVTLNKK